MSRANTLKYSLLSQYLEPKTLDEPKNTNSKFKKSMDIEIANFDEKFVQILRAFDRSFLKNGVEISIYGGIFETDLLALAISKLANVKSPKPGPISTTFSMSLGIAWMILSSVALSCKKFCPKCFFAFIIAAILAKDYLYYDYKFSLIIYKMDYNH